MAAPHPQVAFIGARGRDEVIVTVTPARAPPIFKTWKAAMDWCRENGITVFNEEAAKIMIDYEERRDGDHEA